MRVLITGAAGFIGYHVAQRLLSEDNQVVGLDNLNTYYDVSLKEARLQQLEGKAGFEFVRGGLENQPVIGDAFSGKAFDAVIHLAAQAGVRYSLTHPHEYVQSNLVGFMNILEACRQHDIPNLVYASSSSVYGMNRTMPFRVSDSVDHPVSLYAATKKSNELMAHAYSHLYRLPTTGLRFFTVYGPWGRPDMAYFIFTRKILEGEPIQLFNHGNMKRDFTYIDDIVEGVCRVAKQPAQASPDWDATRPDPATSSAPYRVYNIGNHQPVELKEFVSTIEEALGMKATIESLPMQPGDVEATAADVDDLNQAVGFRPQTPLSEGIQKFVSWYRDYYGK
jgi:UDP-glucuronate 4-epimerase